MAYIDVLAEHETLIRVKVGGLDTGWNEGTRYCHWYISPNGYTTSSSYYDGYSTLGNGVNSGGTYEFERLSSGTTYYISCVIKEGGGSTLTTLKTTATTDSPQIVIDPWSWSFSTSSGEPFALTRDEWIQFQNFIDVVRLAYGKGKYGFTRPNEGLFYAWVFDAARGAIDEIPGHGTLPPKVTSGDIIYGSYFEDIAAAINAAI